MTPVLQMMTKMMTTMMMTTMMTIVIIVTTSHQAVSTVVNGNRTTPTFFVQVDAEMRNQTRAQGDQVRLNCEITGHPVPTYAWFKNDRRLDENVKMKRMKILSTYWGSRLKIERLNLNDTGLYTCIATNQHANQSASAYLEVLSKNNFTNKKKNNNNNNNSNNNNNDNDNDNNNNENNGGDNYNHNEDDDDDDDYYYDYDDDDESAVEYEIVYVENGDVDKNDVITDGANNNNNKNTINNNNNNNNKNTINNNKKLKHRKKQNPPPQPNCSPYMGDVCRGAFNNNITLSSSSSSLLSSSPGFMPPLAPIVNVAVIHEVGSQSFVEKRLASLKLGMMTSKTADDTCVRIATVYLCRLFFKTCGSHSQAFQQHEQQQQQRRRQRPRKPQFEDETPSSILSLLCYDDCKTFESEKCQAEREIIRLSSSAAEFSNLLPKDASCVSASHGVGLYGPKPEKNPNHCIWRPPTSSPHDQVNHIIYVVAVLAASILIVCLLAIFIKRRCSSEEKSLEAKKKQLKDLESSNNSNALLSNNMMSKKAAPGMLLNGKEQPPTYQSNQFQSHYPNTVVSSSSSGHNSVAMYNNVPTVSAVNISFLYPIGSGHFGPVYAGQLIDHQSNIMFPQQQALLQQQKPVIVATLSEHADPTVKTRFEKELRSISSLRHDHQNVLKCVALCHAGSPRSLLYEFVDGVDLKQHLNLLTSTNSFDLPSALDYGCQVARGLEYMSEQGYYHGDLAARNVLVPKTADRCLRLTNLGVSRQVYEADYCLCPCQQVLSLRWCPTEQVVSGEAGWFTEIWSMGVLLWEIFTGGNRPYGILSDSQLLLEMQSGKQPVPQLPVEFPQEIRETVDGCWHPDPQRRVTATTLRKNLENAGLKLFNVTKNNGNIITVNNSALSGPNVASCQSNQNTLGPTFPFHSPQTVYTMHQQQKHLQKQNLTTGQTSSQLQQQQQQQQRLQQQQPLSPTTSSNHTSSTNLVNSPIKSCAINNLTPAVNTINDDDEDDDDYASDADDDDDERHPALKQYPC